MHGLVCDLSPSGCILRAPHDLSKLSLRGQIEGSSTMRDTPLKRWTLDFLPLAIVVLIPSCNWTRFPTLSAYVHRYDWLSTQWQVILMLNRFRRLTSRIRCPDCFETFALALSRDTFLWPLERYFVAFYHVLRVLAFKYTCMAGLNFVYMSRSWCRRSY